LYVTPTFAYLNLVLEEFIKWRCTGGLSELTNWLTLNAWNNWIEYWFTNFGIFSSVIEHEGKPIYIQTTGKTALAYREKN
jgi:phenylalanine-4-hydroxylase